MKILKSIHLYYLKLLKLPITSIEIIFELFFGKSETVEESFQRIILRMVNEKFKIHKEEILEIKSIGWYNYKKDTFKEVLKNISENNHIEAIWDFKEEEMYTEGPVVVLHCMTLKNGKIILYEFLDYITYKFPEIANHAYIENLPDRRTYVTERVNYPVPTKNIKSR
jgi:hypothetical protein